MTLQEMVQFFAHQSRNWALFSRKHIINGDAQKAGNCAKIATSLMKHAQTTHNLHKGIHALKDAV